MSEQVRCDTCRFWEGPINDYEGSCLRYPPVKTTAVLEFIVLNRREPTGDEKENLLVDARPITMKHEWCGEWDGRGE